MKALFSAPSIMGRLSPIQTRRPFQDTTLRLRTSPVWDVRDPRQIFIALTWIFLKWPTDALSPCSSLRSWPRQQGAPSRVCSRARVSRSVVLLSCEQRGTRGRGPAQKTQPVGWLASAGWKGEAHPWPPGIDSEKVPECPRGDCPEQTVSRGLLPSARAGERLG